jgi:polar amino acid transport system substrate-binding protein
LKTSSNIQYSILRSRGFNIQTLVYRVLVSVCFLVFGVSLSFSGPKELTLAVGLALPPYNIPETNSGIELEIVREALKSKGYTIKPKYVPFARVKRELRNREADGALTINPDSGIKAFYSDKHIVCQNIVISLKKNKFNINRVKDLKDKSILAFQDATLYLGKDFASMAEQNPEYREIAKQQLQINLLYSNRVDTVVLDKNIFYYHRKYNDMVDISQPIDIWHIFPPTPFSVAFVDEKVRNDFNEGLKQLRDTGRYDEIVKKYIHK